MVARLSRLAAFLLVVCMSVTACDDLGIEACAYDDDGTPPLMVSPCFRANLPETNHPNLPRTLNATCETWCADQTLEATYTMTFSSPDLCPAPNEPRWSVADADEAEFTGIVRCVCSL